MHLTASHDPYDNDPYKECKFTVYSVVTDFFLWPLIIACIVIVSTTITECGCVFILQDVLP